MIQYAEIDGEEYPFMFSLRAVFSFQDSIAVNSMEEMEEEMQGSAINMLDSMLELFEQASKKGAKKADESDKALTAEQIEDFIDEDPAVFGTLNKLFENSKIAQQLDEGEGNLIG